MMDKETMVQLGADESEWISKRYKDATLYVKWLIAQEMHKSTSVVYKNLKKKMKENTS